MSQQRSTNPPTPDGDEQLQFHCFEGADGKIQVDELATCQKQLLTPNEQLLVINKNQGMLALKPVIAKIQSAAEQSLPVSFTVGDKIRILPKIALTKIQSQSQILGSQEQMRKFAHENVGTVSISNASRITAKFLYVGNYLIFNFQAPYRNIQKLNSFSINQLIRVKSDAITVMEIKTRFHHPSLKLTGAVGRVIGVGDCFSELFIQFDSPEINKCLPKGASLPSAWMDPVQPFSPSNENELVELASKQLALFFKAVQEGDIRTAKVLRNNHGVDAESRDAEGKAALHLAFLNGRKDIAVWLLDEVGVDVEKADDKGHRAIHYAASEGNVEILELLIERKAHVDSRNHSGRTALHIAVLNQWLDCVAPLMNNYADANIQDSEGNTPLHIAILNESFEYVDEMLPFFACNWDLRNKEGFNVIHLAVIKNHLKTVKFIMEEQDMCDHLLTPMPKTQSTVLHYACANKNYQLAKLLVDGSLGWLLLDGSLLLAKLLEAKNEYATTPLLIACQNRDHALIELLVESGADVNAVDPDGNTTILLSAYSPVSEEIPTQELSPRIFQIYQSTVGLDSHHSKLISRPILSLIAYLKGRGAPLEAANNSGLALLKTTSGCIAKILNNPRLDFVKQPPRSLYQLPLDSSSCAVNGERFEADNNCDFSWCPDGSKFGHVRDRLGNKYARCGSRKDGSIGYRCVFESSFGRCPAVARRAKSDGRCWKIRLESEHVHPAGGLKRKMDDKDDENSRPSFV